MPNEKDDNFTFLEVRDAQSPNYVMTLSVNPVGGIDISESSKKKINDTSDEYTFKLKCAPLVSYRFTLLVSVAPVINCPLRNFSWVKVCGTGDRSILSIY